MKKFSHPLMDNNITDSDISSLISFLKNNKKKFLLNQSMFLNLSGNGQNGLGQNIVYL